MMIGEWGLAGQGACAGRRSVRYLVVTRSGTEQRSSRSQQLTGVLEENEKGELRSVGGKAHEQDRIATHNEGCSINPRVALSSPYKWSYNQ
jgi:hypothetical protein